MLLGVEIYVYTDHKNLTHKLTAYTTQRVLRWQLLLKEYGPEFHYKTSATNFVANALSCVPTLWEERKDPKLEASQGSDNYCIITHNQELAECFLQHPKFDDQGSHPFHFTTIQWYQEENALLQRRLKGQANTYYH